MPHDEVKFTTRKLEATNGPRATLRADPRPDIHGQIAAGDVSARAIELAALGVPLELHEDILIGAKQISAFIFGPAAKPTKVNRLVQTNKYFPYFKIGNRLCSLKSALRIWIHNQIITGKPSGRTR